MKTLLNGSLSQNITDIVKGGGCPAIPKPFKRHSVIRYFSRFRSVAEPLVDGVVGDGGIYYIASESTPINYYNNINLNAKFPFTASITHGDDVNGKDNYLNISNQTEMVARADLVNTIQNIERADSRITVDMSGYYNYYLFRPSYTQNIIIAGTETPVSKTANLMEFVYLHAKIPKCKSGELYIEIEDFDITGTITNDHFMYVYYWETVRDASTTADALADSAKSGTYPNILDTHNGNAPIKIMNLSDLQGTGTNKKLVIWLDRQKLPSENIAVHVAIGFKPNDLVSKAGYTQDLPSDIIFKFKKATIKIDKTKNGLIAVTPMAFPNYGYKNLKDDTYAEWREASPHFITMPMQYITSAGNVGPDLGLNPITSVGFPRGGARGDNLSWWSGVSRYSGTYPSGLNVGSGNEFFTGPGKTAVENTYIGNTMHSISILKFFQTSLQTINATGTYRIKLPWLGDPNRYKLNAGSFAADSDFEFKVYAGAQLTTASGDYWPNYQALVDSFVLLGTYTAAQLGGGFITNSVTPSNLGFYKNNYARYCEFDGADIPIVGTVCFYLALTKVGEDLKTLSYTVYGALPYATGHDDNYYQNQWCQVKPQYAIDVLFDAGINSSKIYLNYDAMVYQPPQIIDKTAKPTAEKYFT